MPRTALPQITPQSLEHELLHEIARATQQQPRGELLQSIPGTPVVGRTALATKLLRRKLATRCAEWVYERETGARLTVWRYAVTSAGLNYLREHPYAGEAGWWTPELARRDERSAWGRHRRARGGCAGLKGPGT